ncbi:VCBS repeat-containing protein [Abyssalbus ytuae]|uniref:VCBS repeat-containing protein n=1 Tax=Abyssalbus ytuae TaxID=2926907 RepID=A0A9E6ZMW0_9FLAO|nr:VCBS repeat-containing protein [Abyssalbus ytuae]UOB18809.1 VCBS repeat-containing protein [Abyssalbus ytuae]
MIKKIIFLYIILVTAGCNRERELFFNPSPEKTGVTFTNTVTETDDLNILDYLYFYNGGGVAVGDINNDDLPDIYFSGNQVTNKLYLNKGNLQFEDITEKAGVAGKSSWNTGSVMGDINGDGLLDIYVCAVVGINGFRGHNELFINNGNLTFTESSAKYGLDHDSYSSSAAFLDYDLDGDLDIYLLNHAVHSQESFGKADLRNKRTYETGDKLLRNDNGTFTDVSEQAGIYGGVNGYGLGVSVADFNQDGYPDIYVGNDFHEDDYYYLNNGNGTFSEKLKQYFGHTSRFSMGNDVSDINHDGFPDIISLDMLPEDEKILKASDGDENVQMLKMRTERLGYHYQYTRNMLHVNQQGENYSETALLSGIAATDWSWSALFADFNQDGEQDLFISNGIPKRPNDLDYINFTSNEQIRKKLSNTKLIDQKAINMMPTGAIQNYIFEGKKDLRFINQSGKWITNDTLISGASALADLDNDGDMDIVTNNLNQPSTIYINKTDHSTGYLKIKFQYNAPNTSGIGTKVYAYNKGNIQYKELYTVRGFQASSEPIIHFGFGQNTTVDSLIVVWPDKTYEKFENVPTSQTLKISPSPHKKPYSLKKMNKSRKLFKKIENNLGINFTHREDPYIDFNRQKLIPYQISDRGPALAIGDLNQDGKEDIFFGSSKYYPSEIYIQKDSLFEKKTVLSVKNDSINEDVTAAVFDINKDKKNDLFVGTGGGDFFGEREPLLDKIYIQSDSTFTSTLVSNHFENASVIKPFDFDNDGDIDVFTGNHAVSYDFGNIPDSYLLENKNGTFTTVENSEIQKAGMVRDAVWSDFDNDGIKDLIIVGEWMPPRFFKNDRKTLKETKIVPANLNGLWQSIIPFDIDHDGDTDYLLGNWGLNSKFKASAKYPMLMYYGDFDGNKRTETIVSIEKNGKYYPLLSLNELSGQLNILRKKFTSYKEFAGKTTTEIFKNDLLKNTSILKVHTLQSGYLKNENGKFTFYPFNNQLQVSPITSFVEFDFDADGKNEVLAAGNYFGVKPFHSRFDGFNGALIKDENTLILGSEAGLHLHQKAVTHLAVIKLHNKNYLLITINNNQAQIYEIL